MMVEDRGSSGDKLSILYAIQDYLSSVDSIPVEIKSKQITKELFFVSESECGGYKKDIGYYIQYIDYDCINSSVKLVQKKITEEEAITYYDIVKAMIKHSIPIKIKE